MEKQHISNNKLDDYFALARDMKPIEGIRELENKIINAQMGANKSLFHNLKFKIVMSTSIIVISAYITSLFYLGNKTANMIEKPVKSIEKQLNTGHISQKDRPMDESFFHHSIDSKKAMQNICFFDNQLRFPGSSMNNSLYILPPTNPPSFTRPAPQLFTNGDCFGPPKASSVFSVTNAATKPLELDNKHLSRIGFNTGTKILEYSAYVLHYGHFYYYNDGSNDGTGKDEERGIFHKALNFYPAFITESDGTIALNVDSIFHANGKNINDPYSNYAIKMTLLPILFKQAGYNGLHGNQDLVFWFTVTPELKEILKDMKQELPVVQINRYEADYLQSHPSATQIPTYIADTKIKETIIEQSKINLLKAIRLADDQLKKVGFIITPDKIEYKCYVKSYGKFDYFNTPGGLGVNIDCYQAKLDTGQDFYPVFISDMNGEQQIKYRMNNKSGQGAWSEEYFLSRIRTLVPIAVREKGFRIKKRKDLVFWFNVTPSFLALLPDTISKDMGKEYEKLVSNESKTPDTTTVTTCKYFDVCQVPLEQEYGIKIYPNPAKDHINLEFWPPKNDGTVYTTVELTDLNGKVIEKNEFPWYGRTAGMDLNGVKPGIYLVVYKLNTGEVITNKVMITR